MKEGTDVKRASLARSRKFWTFAAAPAVLCALFGWWVLRARPADLRDVRWIVPAPRGGWIAVSGRARGHQPVFLENVETGEFLRAASFGGPFPVISGDGSTAAWSAHEPGVPEPRFTPHTVSLADPRRRATAWEAESLHENPLLVLSPDGRRLAIIAPESVVVRNAAGGGMVAAARPPRALWEQARGWTGATFAGDERLVVYAARSSGGKTRSLDIYAFDLRARIFRQTGTAGPFSGMFPILANAERDRLLVRESAATVHLLDGTTGAVLRTFAGGGVGSRAAVFLSDGGIALFESERGAGRVIALSADGAERTRIPLGAADRAYLLGERRPGALVLVAGSAAELRGRRGRVIVADFAAGRAETWGEGFLPASPYASSLAGDPGNGPAPGSLGTRLFFTPQGALVELEGPGRLRRLLPAP